MLYSFYLMPLKRINNQAKRLPESILACCSCVEHSSEIECRRDLLRLLTKCFNVNIALELHNFLVC